jgi:hypothetical protein
MTANKPPKKPRAGRVRDLRPADKVVLNELRRPLNKYPTLGPFSECQLDGVVLDLTARFNDLFEEFQQGNREALIDALSLCGSYEVVPPSWVVIEAGRCAGIYLLAYTRTLDEAFQVSRPKGAKLEGIRNRVLNYEEVHIHVANAKKEGRAVDMILFEEIGDRLGIGGSTAAQIYYGR